MELRIEEDSWELLAPGEPVWIGGDGHRLGWAVEDLLFLYIPGSSVVEALRLPGGIEAVAPGPEHWSVATDLGVFLVDPEEHYIRAELPLQLEPGERLWVGQDLAVQSGRRQQAWRISDGRAWLLPTKLLDVPCLRPWATGLGTVWASREELGRGSEKMGSFAGLGRIVAGPGGAFVAETAEGLVGAVAAGPLRNFGHLSAEDVVFSPDGRSTALRGALLQLDSGVRRDAPSGRPATRMFGDWLYLLNGRLIQVGERDNLPEGRLWGEEDGWSSLFRSCNLSSAEDGLTGPGGALWDLGSGRPKVTGLPRWVAWDGHRLGWMDEERIGLIDGPSLPHGLLAGGDRLDHLSWEGGVLVGKSLDGERVQWAPEAGLRRGRAWKRRSPVARVDAQFPLPIVGRRKDLAWTAAGMLLRRREIG